MSENPPAVIKPPEIVDHTDNDPPSEYLSLRTAKGYPTKDANETIVDHEMAFSLKIARIKAVKAVLLALIAAIGVLYYTWMLLVR